MGLLVRRPGISDPDPHSICVLDPDQKSACGSWIQMLDKLVEKSKIGYDCEYLNHRKKKKYAMQIFNLTKLNLRVQYKNP